MCKADIQADYTLSVPPLSPLLFSLLTLYFFCIYTVMHYTQFCILFYAQLCVILSLEGQNLQRLLFFFFGVLSFEFIYSLFIMKLISRYAHVYK